MNPGFIKAIVDMIKGVADLCKAVLDASDPEQYAKGVNKLNEGVSDTYTEMRRIIADSDTFSEEEKLKRLSELSEMEAASKKKCEEAIRGNREHIGKVTFEIIAGFLTCGVYFAPAIVQKLKDMYAGNSPVLIEAEVLDSLETESIAVVE